MKLPFFKNTVHLKCTPNEGNLTANNAMQRKENIKQLKRQEEEVKNNKTLGNIEKYIKLKTEGTMD